MDRNRIKRQLREGLKKTQSLNLFPGNCMLVFTGRKQVKTHIIIREIAFLLKTKITFILLKPSLYEECHLPDKPYR